MPSPFFEVFGLPRLSGLIEILEGWGEFYLLVADDEVGWNEKYPNLHSNLLKKLKDAYEEERSAFLFPEEVEFIQNTLSKLGEVYRLDEYDMRWFEKNG